MKNNNSRSISPKLVATLPAIASANETHAAAEAAPSPVPESGNETKNLSAPSPAPENTSAPETLSAFTTAAPAASTALDKSEFLSRMGLPVTTTDRELTAILAANAGESLPIKPAAFVALMESAQDAYGFNQNQAAEYVAEKFPSFSAPVSAPAAPAVNTSAAPVAPVAAKPATDAQKFLRDQFINLYNLPADATDEQIASFASSEHGQHLAEQARRELEAADEVVISDKMRVGLTREQAINVIRRQREHDEKLVKDQAERQPQIIEIISRMPHDLRQARKFARDLFPFLDGAEFHAAVAVFQKSKAA